jgi:hypothetical protein
LLADQRISFLPCRPAQAWQQRPVVPIREFLVLSNFDHSVGNRMWQTASITALISASIGD